MPAEILAKYYLYAFKQYDMLVIVKVDDRMEHSLVQRKHLFLKTPDGGHPDLDSFSIVTWPKNQPMEAFWSLDLLVEAVFSKHGRSKFILKLYTFIGRDCAFLFRGANTKKITQLGTVFYFLNLRDTMSKC